MGPKGSTQPALSGSDQSLATFLLYVVIMMFLAVFSRTAISSTFGVFQQFIRTLLYVTSWPIYIGLLPIRALLFLASLSVKVLFFGAMAAILYFVLGGALNFGAMQDTFGAALQYFLTSSFERTTSGRAMRNGQVKFAFTTSLTHMLVGSRNVCQILKGLLLDLLQGMVYEHSPVVKSISPNHLLHSI